ncbi:hypothetical protein MVEN_00383100 [Mycena venus]|uniref:Alpha/gamma-adaptin-binding protein p34 n=1 Tax=Mycena venus TaxID=2733690 RepID=A0A8H6YPY8_9AGAR|nr:hypothetical protein MVEN_00383100 [Mycena venus]
MSTSSAGSIDFSPLDSSTCRILTVSSTLDRAVSLVNRIRNLRSTSPPEAADTTAASISISASETQTQHSGLGESTRVPWTLSNKYYSADVHFAAHTITGLAPHVVRNVPAVIFVWAKGEAYKHHVERLAGDMSGYEPEVSLAVCVAPSSSAEQEDKDENEDDEEAEIDEFLSSNGFEFIDASNETPSAGESEPFSQGIPGLPRVLDALSTIMWPSMQAKAKPVSTGLSRVARRDFDWAQTSHDDLSPIKTSMQPTRGRTGNREQEMDELTRWLEGDDDHFASREDPWRPAPAVVTSPTGIDAPGFPDPNITKEEFGGFDDDFTVFVSAPPVPTEGEEDFDGADDSFDSPTEERLGAPGASPLYLSLGSGLDLREVQGDEKAAVEAGATAKDGDEDLPTDAEIEAMSERIFGGPLRNKSDVDSEAPPPVETERGDAEYDMAPFDLSRVMSALEGMKAEIASMSDEGERRKAAAKVALGLVYGLEADAGVDSL